MKRLNLLLFLFLELANYTVVGWWGFATFAELPARLLMGVGGIVVLITVWVLFGAPGARWPLVGLGRVALLVVWFGAGVAALCGLEQWVLAVAFAVLCVVSAGLETLWGQYRPVAGRR
ncbi:uncharacterized protein DUF2568 [Stackebrandtia albiflava]|uniref:Uncharacterized protein DUF2568 n=1 Tax=Stackebrandtia albiflava TaxID=406432 RepID=A0A562VG92_9ACTN|nr:YrdB family protein [Stackebrandtia albiflava]TWJ16898.1 uncharacterized protein DUF2568 [Stackebrandtia albiflava]